MARAAVPSVTASVPLVRPRRPRSSPFRGEPAWATKPRVRSFAGDGQLGVLITELVSHSPHAEREAQRSAMTNADNNTRNMMIEACVM